MKIQNSILFAALLLAGCDKESLTKSFRKQPTSEVQSSALRTNPPPGFVAVCTDSGLFGYRNPFTGTVLWPTDTNRTKESFTDQMWDISASSFIGFSNVWENLNWHDCK